MLTLYITRHGQTEWNTAGRMQGWENGELTEAGIQDAIALGERLADIPLEAVYASTSKRAYHTAELIIGNRDIPLIKDELLREMGFGDWEGKTKEEITKHFPEEFKALWETPHLYKRDQGEMYAQVKERVEAALEKIKTVYHTGSILIVTHSITLRMMLLVLKNLELDQFTKQIRPGNTSLTKVIFQDGQTEIVFEGDVSHVKDV